MLNYRIIFKVIGIGASLTAILLLLWVAVSPLISDARADVLVDDARQLLSTPLAERSDVEDVDCQAASDLLQLALEIAPSHGTARGELNMARGCTALLRGDLVLAEGGLKAAARSIPNDPRPHCWLGALSLARDVPEQARLHFQEALEQSPKNPIALIGISDALLDLGLFEDALVGLDEIEDAQQLAAVQIRRGLIFEALERDDEARMAYGRAIELSPRAAEPRNNLSALERDSGNITRAWELQRSALEISPEDPVLLLNAGLLAVALGRDGEAQSLLRRAIELERESPDAARALADHLLVTGHAAEALQEITPAIERFPRDAALRNSLGNALAAVGRVEEARRAYRRALEIDPTLAEPHNGLAAQMMSAGELDAAQHHLGRAAQLDPFNSQVRRNLDILHRRLGQQDQAESSQHIAQAFGETR